MIAADRMASFLHDLEPGLGDAGPDGYESSDDAAAGGVSQLRPAVQRLAAAEQRMAVNTSESMKQLRHAEMEIWASRLRSMPLLEQRRQQLGDQARGYRPAFGCAGACVSAWALEARRKI